MPWIYQPLFDQLTPGQLYDILKLRQQIFIIEQECIYPDIDDLDQKSGHLMLYRQQSLEAYCRIVPPLLKFTETSIGRVVVSSEQRGRGLGKNLIEKAIAVIESDGVQPITIEAQTYLEAFYNGFGFKTKSEPYDVDGILHILMKREPPE